MGSGASSGRSGGRNAALPPELPCLKIALVGDPGVGKTSVLLRYLRNQFSPMYIPTKKVAIENIVHKLNVPSNTVVSVTFWDIPGREDMDIHKSYFRNLDAAIVIVDMSNKVTMDMANVWKQTVLNRLTRTVTENNKKGGQEVKEVSVDPVTFPVLLLGNKFDIIEEEMLRDLANRKVSVSMEVSEEMELHHESITHLQAVADEHNFIGSVMVSAKQTDSSVTIAIQSLVRNLLEKKNLPRKWKSVPPKPKPPKKEKPFVYEKLEKVDIDKLYVTYKYEKLEMTTLELFDGIIEKADTLVKETMIFQHYLTVALARFKDVCVKGHLVEDESASFEDCISCLKKETKEGSVLKVSEDEGFYRLEVVMSDDSVTVKQSKAWKHAYKCFHKEYAAVCKAILKEGPQIVNTLEQHDLVLGKILDDNQIEQHVTERNVEQRAKMVIMANNKVVHNRARVQHARGQMSGAVTEVQRAGRKMSNVEHW